MNVMRRYNSPLLCGAWAEGSDSSISHLICGGGGGDGDSGVRNNFVLVQYDSDSKQLSEERHSYSTENDVALKLAVHPNRREFVCSLIPNERHNGKLKHLKLTSEKHLQIEDGENGELKPLQNVGEQRGMAFNADGKLFASGGDDGHLRVFKWPSLEVVLDRSDAHRSIKDLDFSLDGSFLAATDDVGPSRVWDLKQLAPAAALPLNRAGFCRFSRDGARPCLYVTSAEDSKGYITTWSMKWKKIGSKKVSEEPISAFNISSDGKLLAIGSPEGQVLIVNANKLNVLQRITNAHMFFVTAVDFSADNRSLLSLSADYSARVTSCQTSQRGWRTVFILWIILIAAILSLVLSRGFGRGSTISDSHEMI